MSKAESKELTADEAEDILADRLAKLFIYQIRKDLDEERKIKKGE